MRLLAQESKKPALLFRKAGFLDSITYTCSRKAEGDKKCYLQQSRSTSKLSGPILKSKSAILKLGRKPVR